MRFARWVNSNIRLLWRQLKNPGSLLTEVEADMTHLCTAAHSAACIRLSLYLRILSAFYCLRITSVGVLRIHMDFIWFGLVNYISEVSVIQIQHTCKNMALYLDKNIGCKTSYALTCH